LAISSEAQMEKEIDAYLSILLDMPRNFHFFPLWKSQLEVLKWIYAYYSRLPADSRAPLEQALKLLMLIHAGGDLRVKPEHTSLSIARQYFPNVKLDKVTPCFIRAQLGPIFSKMSHQYMLQVLKALEILSPTDNPSKFPIIICTFSVLMMAMESLQFHVAKLPYHTHHDSPPPDLALLEPPTRDLDEMDKSDVLIRFYKATNCHARLNKLGTGGQASEVLAGLSCDAETRNILSSLHCAILSARPYLIAKRHNSLVLGTDMTAFFDRLLSKMYLT